MSIRALLPLLHARAPIDIKTVELELDRQGDTQPPQNSADYRRVAQAKLQERRALGSITGYFPVLWVDGTPIHEALAINEWTAEAYPAAQLWPTEPLRRAQARALACEMASGFTHIRHNLSCHIFAHVPQPQLDGPTQEEIARIFELSREALQRSGGPFLFGPFGIVDAMYLPVYTRFATYNIPLPSDLTAYQTSLNALPATQQWRTMASNAPAIPIYDDYIEQLGGSVGLPSNN